MDTALEEDEGCFEDRLEVDCFVELVAREVRFPVFVIDCLLVRDVEPRFHRSFRISLQFVVEWDPRPQSVVVRMMDVHRFGIQDRQVLQCDRDQFLGRDHTFE